MVRIYFFQLIFLYLFFSKEVFAAESGGMPQLNPEFWISQIFWLIISFGILFIALSKFILPKIRNNIEFRKSEILDNIETIFDWIEPNRLAMVEDKPWTKRRPDMRGLLYYNSGIVAFNGDPQILHQWAYNVEKNPQQGDQETLHAMMESPLSQRVYITDLPNEYNWLRLQLEHDNQDSNKKKAIHWTGPKGKEKIRSKMKQWEK